MSREVLAPSLMRLGPNRCYRVNSIHEDFGDLAIQQKRHNSNAESGAPKPPAGYVEPDFYHEDDDDDELEASGHYTLEEMHNSSSFKLTMHVAPAFYGGIIGFKGSTKQRLQLETHTEIYIPRAGEKVGNKAMEDISIKGQKRSNVLAARRKIILLISSLRKRMRPTHYVGVPLNEGEVNKNFSKFKETILAANYPGVEESLFPWDDNVHLTLATCVLLDDEERARGVDLLQSCREYLSDLKTPFEIRVKGLEIMNDDPSAVRVLYACVEAPALQEFANRLQQAFLKSGLGFDQFERDNVKLHMTVMNKRYHLKTNKETEASFDARDILKKYGEYNFGVALCNEVNLCIIGAAAGKNFITGSLKF